MINDENKRCWGLVVTETSNCWHLSIYWIRFRRVRVLCILLPPNFEIKYHSSQQWWINYKLRLERWFLHMITPHRGPYFFSCLKLWSHHCKSAFDILSIYLPPLLIWTSISSFCSACRAYHPYKPTTSPGSNSTTNINTLVEYIRLTLSPLLNKLG